MRAVVRLSALRETFRDSDVVARLGGDEFAVLAADADLELPDPLLTRLQLTIETHNEQHPSKYPLSLSAGAVRHDPENPCTLDELIRAADAKMYTAKRNKAST